MLPGSPCCLCIQSRKKCCFFMNLILSIFPLWFTTNHETYIIVERRKRNYNTYEFKECTRMSKTQIKFQWTRLPPFSSLNWKLLCPTRFFTFFWETNSGNTSTFDWKLLYTYIFSVFKVCTCIFYRYYWSDMF